jgi:hypothetical protein
MEERKVLGQMWMHRWRMAGRQAQIMAMDCSIEVQIMTST